MLAARRFHPKMFHHSRQRKRNTQVNSHHLASTMCLRPVLSPFIRTPGIRTIPREVQFSPVCSSLNVKGLRYASPRITHLSAHRYLLICPCEFFGPLGLFFRLS